MAQNDFYNGGRLLSMKDANGKKPEIYAVAGNRTAGKTYFVKRYCVRRFMKYGEKFVIFVRYIDDVPNTAAAFWADVGPDNWPKLEIKQIPLLHGKAGGMLIGGKPAGYVIALSDPERIKKASSLFADAARGFLDEFASETGKYVPGEVKNFNSIRVSIARGGGSHVRYFPVIMCANMVTNYSPYHTYFGFSRGLQERTRFHRGAGWVYEQTYNATAADEMEKHFSSLDKKQLDYMAHNKMLLDTDIFIEKVEGAKWPFCSVIYEGDLFTIWGGFRCPVFVSSKLRAPDSPIFAATVDDHSEKTALLMKGTEIYKSLQKAYNLSNVRFDGQKSKNAFYSVMQINK